MPWLCYGLIINGLDGAGQHAVLLRCFFHSHTLHRKQSRMKYLVVFLYHVSMYVVQYCLPSVIIEMAYFDY